MAMRSSRRTWAVAPSSPGEFRTTRGRRGGRRLGMRRSLRFLPRVPPSQSTCGCHRPWRPEAPFHFSASHCVSADRVRRRRPVRTTARARAGIPRHSSSTSAPRMGGRAKCTRMPRSAAPCSPGTTTDSIRPGMSCTTHRVDVSGLGPVEFELSQALGDHVDAVLQALASCRPARRPLLPRSCRAGRCRQCPTRRRSCPCSRKERSRRTRARTGSFGASFAARRSCGTRRCSGRAADPTCASCSDVGRVERAEPFDGELRGNAQLHAAQRLARAGRATGDTLR